MAILGWNGPAHLRRAIVAFAALAAMTPAIASDAGLCVQTQLAQLGYQPGPADGALGRQSVGAAKAFAHDAGLTLPDLADETAQQWCDGVQAFGATPRAAILKTFAAQLLPKDVLLNFSRVDPSLSATSCHTWATVAELRKIEPVRKIEGFSSRQYGDEDHIPGAVELDQFGFRFAGVAAEAFVAGDARVKGQLLDILEKWASQHALLDSVNCLRPDGSFKKNLCTQWTVPDGSDLSPIKDWEYTMDRAAGLIRAYYIALADFEPEERQQQHQIIRAWLAELGRRLQAPSPGGPDQIFEIGRVYLAAVVNDYINGNPSAARAKLLRVEAALDRVVFSADGSIQQSTTRGDRALWYHFAGIGDAVIAMELIRAAGIPISNRVEERLHKAVALFLAAVKDPDVLDRWARQRHNSTYNGFQIFDFAKWPDEIHDASWFHIYVYRYPDREEAKALRRLVPTTADSASIDSRFGIGLGCVYNAAAVGRDLTDLKPSP